MFTGIIEELGQLLSIRPFGKARRLEIAATVTLEDCLIGDSIAVNGVCLTVVALTGRSFTVEAVEETMQKTTLDHLHTGTSLNLERALRANGKLGGHFVQGHVDFTAELRGIEKREGSWMVECSYPDSASPNIISMGSIAIDGVSLTVAEKQAGSFRVSVIPHTFSTTLFERYRAGTRVNIELDMLGKYILNYLSHLQKGEGVSNAYLKDLGY
ncbi:MAG: riboflavin synthase [Bacteroidetes bacterium]|nr:riboflavin synthase [Bacteroidota bacterium]